MERGLGLPLHPALCFPLGSPRENWVPLSLAPDADPDGGVGDVSRGRARHSGSWRARGAPPPSMCTAWHMPTPGLHGQRAADSRQGLDGAQFVIRELRLGLASGQERPVPLRGRRGECPMLLGPLLAPICTPSKDRLEAEEPRMGCEGLAQHDTAVSC